MSIDTDNNKKRFRAVLTLLHPTHRVSRDTAHADYLREIGADGLLTSPKIYESGIITSLELRLVDLYGDCAFKRKDPNRGVVGHTIAC